MLSAYICIVKILWRRWISLQVLAVALCILNSGSALARDGVAHNKALRFVYAFDIGGQPSFSTIQDRDGFLWFGSFFNGLVRYDGSSVKQYRGGPGSISSDFVTQLFEDRASHLSRDR